MAVKIAIAGTHSTGKTTLLANVECKLLGRGLRVTRVGNLAVEAKACGFPILRHHTFTSTLWIMTRGISLELEAGLSSDIVLVDRPVSYQPGADFAPTKSEAAERRLYPDSRLRQAVLADAAVPIAECVWER